MEKLNHLESIVYIDLLTGLHNRRYLEKYLSDYIFANINGNCSIIFIDLDNFKLINDSLGHEQGDEVLKRVAKLFIESSKSQMLVTRLNGDQFVLVIPSDRGEQAEYFSRVISDHLHSEGLRLTPDFNHIHLTLSIGISVYPDDAQQPKELLRHADSAMLAVKRSGKHGLKRYNSTDDGSTEDQQRMVHDLHGAIERNEISILFQPIYNVDGGKISKLEVLMRWQHPTLGFVLPEIFIPLAEQFGLIVPLGQWVIKQSCRFALHWDGIQVCVNVSALQLSQTNFIQELAHALAEYQIKPSQLALELTETVLMQENPHTERVLQQINDMGVDLIIDDFGMGYSNLNRLRTLPIQALKIDRSFTANVIGTETKHLYAQQMVTATVSLSDIASLKVTAEGVETREQLEMMQRLGCHFGQGYFFSKPYTPEQIDALLLEALPFGLPHPTAP
ncbi:bifunctional diguanylate cyclase/phosphodiesterase [Deinococcus sp. QL22]|uniref:putative bifunctional diguanylate cyclase/phosphodiesterase n=1 Tax=Deinococcus sp. QL22 TaxID=2939437 RepID=UPI002016AE50|nr:bifunctional diguanylate cyclase/phosphodiesterase [Deinococcus sp. QL22]UQN07155.1 bifunctional diguanylate cyclase/phosphodiesterase [Deinococcus sp. QL22]